MITEIVLFDLPEGLSRGELMDKYMGTAEAWSKNDDLVQKYYFHDTDKNQGGGIYIWKSKEAMNLWHGEEYKSRIRHIYGSDPQITYFDILIHVNNLQGRVDKFEKT